MRAIILETDGLEADVLRHLLQRGGYEVESFLSTSSSSQVVRKVNAHGGMLLMSTSWPDALEVCRRLRRGNHGVVILVLGVKGSEAEECAFLEAGADDYLQRPISASVLLARCRAHQRRADLAHQNGDGLQLVIGPLQLLPEGVLVNGEPVRLSPMELRLLHALARRRGQVASREELLRECWGEESEAAPSEVDIYINRLRRKLGQHLPDGQIVATVRRQGFRIQAEGFAFPGATRTPLTLHKS